MPLEECSKCGRHFQIYMTAEERLLRAIFGQAPTCKKCLKEEFGDQCSDCGKYAEYVIGLNDEQLCSSCLGKRYQ